MRREGRELRESLGGGRLLAERFGHVIEEEGGGRAVPRCRRRSVGKRKEEREERGRGGRPTGSGRGGT